MINPNTTRNVVLLYYHPGGGVNCLPVFFGPEFKINFYDFEKSRVFKISPSILLNQIKLVSILQKSSSCNMTSKRSVVNIFINF